MAHFTEEQLKELETIFGIKRVISPDEYLPVKDGIVRRGDQVWWASNQGPQQSVADDGQGTWTNIKNHPHLYSIEKPRVAAISYEGS